MAVRLLSYLAPSVPFELFRVVATHLQRHLGCEVELSFDPSRSGPRPGEHEPFSTAEADFAFVCATSYVWLTTGRDPAIELVGVGWLPTDPRVAGRPVYFGDVLAPLTGVRRLGELAGRRVAYNDDVSLSGYHSLRLALTADAVDVSSVEFVRSGSHLRSLELLTAGRVDAAAIDSNVWRRRAREAPGLRRRLTPIATLGPHPVQPLVARADLPAELRARVRHALVTAHHDAEVVAAMSAAELRRFVPLHDHDFRSLRRQLVELGLDGAGVP